MDNLFELLILLVFILSGLNSLFGNKKKRRKQMEEAQKNENTKPKYDPPEKKKFPGDETDLLEELFGIKKDKKEAPDPFEEPAVKKQTNYENDYRNYQHYENEQSWNPEDDFKDASETKNYEMKKRQSIFEQISKIDFDKKSPAKPALEKIKIIEDKVLTSKNTKALELIEILKNKKSVKNSFLIAEILGKPKAHRFRENHLFR